MSFVDGLRRFLRRLFRKNDLKIGIYGPPNAGKTTLANRIVMDWEAEAEWSIRDLFEGVSKIPHETRRARRKGKVKIKVNGNSLTLDIVDMPGLATKIDFHDFLHHGLSEEEARKRAKEATEGVIEAIKWLNDLDGVLLVMDATDNPFTQVNVTVVGNMEARKLPIIIVANKIDLPGASPARIKSAFPQHPVVPVSALKGDNMEKLYEAMAKYFG
ncbi:MAG: GTPase [Archaeoglobi archaeon]|nr:GTP-binding protein [Candidatus Mnemosynella bozhongmuii]MDI3502147.1 GTPase [Archaeoglobi archaeon]MDK2781141.1 GTPase [Archaeoglobi archaeon]